VRVGSMIAAIVRAFATLWLREEWAIVRSQIERHQTFLLLHRHFTPPRLAQLLLISGEDRRHGRHPGYDVQAMIRAFVHRAFFRSREGASSIEQQIVRVVTGRFERTWRRKVREILLASLVASHFPKQLTPSLYLSIGYYGWRMNSFVQASRRLALLDDLSLADAAALVARLKYPEPRNPPKSRLQQIDARMRYLKNLYEIHRLDGTYGHLGIVTDGTTIRHREEPTGALGSTPCG
jgi:membrane peptidoglycan carboxypeptidase